MPAIQFRDFPMTDAAPASVVTLAEVAPGKLLRVQIFPILEQPLIHPKGPMKFDRAFAEAVCRNFAAYAGSVPGDFLHGAERENATPEQARASGWIKAIRIEGSAVVAYMAPTAEALAFVEADQYRFASPSVAFEWIDPATGKSVGPLVLSVALTNRPFIRGMDAVEVVDPKSVTLSDRAASDTAQGEKPPEDSRMPDPIKPEGSAISLADHTAAITTLADKLKASDAQIVTLGDQLKAADAKVKSLEDAKVQAVAVADLEKLEAAGKITPAQRASLLPFRLSSPEAFAAFSATLAEGSAVKLAPKGIQAPADAEPGAGERALVKFADEIEKAEKCGPNEALSRAMKAHPELAAAV